MKKALAVAGVALVAIALTIFFWKGTSSDPEMPAQAVSPEAVLPAKKILPPTPVDPDKKLVLTEEMIQSRGPRPSMERVRGSSQQIETAEQASEALEAALARVNQEIAENEDDAKREALLAKKKLILKTMDYQNR